MNKLITLTVAAGPACSTGAQAQALQAPFFVASGPIGGNGYLPKVAGDSDGNFVVVDQKASGTTAINAQLGSYPGSGDKVTWNSPVQLSMGTGHAPAISVVPGSYIGYGQDVYVEVNQGATSGTMYYHLGVGASGGGITWSSGVQFDSIGWNPVVSIYWSDPFNNTTAPVIMVYQGDENYSPLWYMVGNLDLSGEKPAITWAISQPFDNGYAPSVTSCNQNIIEVHEGEGGALMYSMAALDLKNGSIGNWSASTQYDTGYNPSVVSCGGNGEVADVAEVHQASNPPSGTSSALMAKAGVFSWGGSSIAWTSDVLYAIGCYPTVAAGSEVATLDYSWWLTEVHSATCGQASALTYDLGAENYAPN